jgi:hypothetical protein
VADLGNRATAPQRLIGDERGHGVDEEAMLNNALVSANRPVCTPAMREA